jgi:hypothetical protein
MAKSATPWKRTPQIAAGRTKVGIHKEIDAITPVETFAIPSSQTSGNASSLLRSKNRLREVLIDRRLPSSQDNGGRHGGPTSLTPRAKKLCVDRCGRILCLQKPSVNNGGKQTYSRIARVNL